MKYEMSIEELIERDIYADRQMEEWLESEWLESDCVDRQLEEWLNSDAYSDLQIGEVSYDDD